MTPASPDPYRNGPVLHHRVVAVANANWFRALAWRALRDGAEKGALRAANARAAARIVLRQARKNEMLIKPVIEALALAA